MAVNILWNSLMVVLFLIPFFRYRSLQWVLSCATSLQCRYLPSYIRWSWEGQSCCHGSRSSRDSPESKATDGFLSRISFLVILSTFSNVKNSSLSLSVCTYFYLVSSLFLFMCVVIFWWNWHCPIHFFTSFLFLFLFLLIFLCSPS